KFHPPPQSLHHHHHLLTKETSQEADSTTTTNASAAVAAPDPPPSTKPNVSSTNEVDGETIEVIRRPRGRPPGTKNKPKHPTGITREPDPYMSPYILEVGDGVDIIDSLTHFTRLRSASLCVLTASGTVANVTLKQPFTTTPSGTFTFHGRFDILSLSAVVTGGGYGKD
ncbi:hypothetical protein Dimus_025052, partial [Dionaea muscipula]